MSICNLPSDYFVRTDSFIQKLVTYKKIYPRTPKNIALYNNIFKQCGAFCKEISNIAKGIEEMRSHIDPITFIGVKSTRYLSKARILSEVAKIHEDFGNIKNSRKYFTRAKNIYNRVFQKLNSIENADCKKIAENCRIFKESIDQKIGSLGF